MHLQYLILVLASAFLAAALPYGSTRDKKSSYLVGSLPGLYSNIPLDEIPLMFSGQLPLYEENNTHYYFWKHTDNHKASGTENRTIFWLNGGPGCSSMDGALMEAGPFRIDKNLKVTYNNGSWHKLGDIVFVDQPAGTGFSYSDELDHDLPQITNEFIRFLERFFELFPEDSFNLIYLAGESYAGQYIPYIADAVLRRNKNLGKNEKPFNLKGLLIGNGYVAPDAQALSYLPYAIQAGILDPKNPEWHKVLRQHEACQNSINDASREDKAVGSEVSSHVCERVLSLILEASRDPDRPEDQQCINVYDYTLRDSYPSCGMNWPPDLSYVTPFLRKDPVLRDLNIENHQKWKECSGKVSLLFKAKHSMPSVTLLPSILEQIPIILFNGNRDIICNYIGTENFIKEMKWNGQTGFPEDAYFDWKYGNVTAGYIKKDRNLTFVNVFDASHMVPFDKPEISRSLIDLVTGDFIEKTEETGDGKQKRTITTYPLGARNANGSSNKPEASSEVSGTQSENTTDTETPSHLTTSSEDKNDKSQTLSSRIARIIQLVVVVVLIWGIYILYSSYKSRPTSIIKSKSSNKKKNVQWADQLRQFEEEEIKQNERGILYKAFNKLKGSNNRSKYTPLSGNLTENIELEEGPQIHDKSETADDFAIGSDDEEHEGMKQSSKGHDDSK